MTPDDLSGMADPVPHYRDIRRDTPREHMHRAIARLANTVRIMLWAALLLTTLILGWKAHG